MDRMVKRVEHAMMRLKCWRHVTEAQCIEDCTYSVKDFRGHSVVCTLKRYNMDGSEFDESQLVKDARRQTRDR